MFRLKIEKIRSILFERGLSIISISRAIGESENMIYKIFREQKYVRPYLAVKIADFLRSEIREIAERVNE
jgi:transcriptional regulator with XRE-family HTH domain